MFSPRFTWRTALLLATVVWTSPTRALSDEAGGAPQAASASPAAHENRPDEDRPDEDRPDEDRPLEQLAPQQLMRQAGPVLQDLAQRWHELLVAVDEGPRNQSRPESPAQTRRRVLRRLWRPYTLKVERDLKSILKQVSEETGLEYRFEPEALRETGVDPAQAFVVYHAENEPLITVLREVLHVYGLQPGLEGAVVVIVALPSLPPGVHRSRPVGHAPIPDVSGGTIVVRDERETITPMGGTPTVDRWPEPAENEELKAARSRVKQFYQQQHRLISKRELQACLTLTNASPEQEQQLRALVEGVENDLSTRCLDVWSLVYQKRGAAKRQELYPEVRQSLESAILRELQQLGNSEWIENYQRQRACRAAHRQRAAIRLIVMCVDGRLALTSDQRIALEQHLRRQWQPDWERALAYLPGELSLVPQIPGIEDLITSEQQIVWSRLRKCDLNWLDEMADDPFFSEAPDQVPDQ